MMTSILSALGGQESGSEFDMLRQLADLSGLPVPPPLAGLQNEAVRFDAVCGKDEMRAAVCAWLEKGAAR